MATKRNLETDGTEIDTILQELKIPRRILQDTPSVVSVFFIFKETVVLHVLDTNT